MKDPKVCILLAAHNGQQYIGQMIDSVLMQDYENIQLVLSDDGSKDDTQRILAEYAASNPDKVVLYKSGKVFGCAQDHFLHLLSVFHDEPYIMFCDQDDVWHRDKVSRTLEKMLELEAEAAAPVMVHTDMRVVDEQLQEISPSFWHHSNLDGSRLALNQLLVQNVVTGCAVMINHSLAELVCSHVPHHVMMHDWWIALVASVCGKTGHLAEQTLDYRQHGHNAVGAKNVRSASYLWKRLVSHSMRGALRENTKQAESLLECYRSSMDDDQIALITAFIRAQECPLLIRDYIYIRYGLLKYGTIRKIAQLLGL